MTADPQGLAPSDGDLPGIRGGTLLDSLLDDARLGTVLLDRELRCVQCNVTAAAIARSAPDAICGRLAADALGSLWPALQPVCEGLLLHGRPVRGLEVSTHEGGDPDRLARIWTVSAHPLRSIPGAAAHGIGLVLQDVTEHRRREAELQRTCEAAEQAGVARERFLATLSHELRTPLTPALLAVQALERDVSLSPGVRSVLATVERNLRLEVALVDDLLDLNRIAHGKVELRLTAVDVHEAVARAVEICAGDARARRISVAVRAQATRTVVLADAMRVQQVLWNLLKNSLKFSLPGGQVEITTRNEGADILVDVSDHGIGIEPQTLPLLFHAFEQGSLPRGQRGSGLGLGLALGRSLAELHGGSLSALSAGAQQGATFCLRLPLERPGAARKPGAAGPSASLCAAPLSILLVEDHEDSASMMAAMLSLRGWRVRVAATAAEALELAQGETFDLLVSDVNLPDGSGCDLLAQLREMRAADAPALHGIALSGFGMPADVRASLDAGYTAHLVKPLDIDALFDAIAAALGAGAGE